MNHNYGSEKVLNCNHPFGGSNSWYQQEPNVSSWLDYNYRDTYHYSGQTQNLDYILNFDENHHDAQSQYYQQQQQSNITEFNYDMHIRHNNAESRQLLTNVTSQPDHIVTSETQRLSGVSSSLSQVSPVIQQIQSNESALLNKTDLYCHTSTLSPVSSSDKSSISNEAYNKNHIYAEKKRRQNIKQGFDSLRTLINTSSPGHKISNARLLTKSHDHIKRLKNERAVFDQKIKTLKLELKALNESLSSIQETLPMSGASMEQTTNASDHYQEFLKEKTNKNWKFWIFAKIFNPVVQAVISGDHGEQPKSLDWIDQKCPIIQMRLATSNMLREVSLNTDLLTERSSILDQEITKLINKNQ